MSEINNQSPLSSKKPYQEPRLWVYGDIGALTQTLLAAGAMADTFPALLTKTS